jgi:SAM-dependent methyltransferase
VTPDVHDTAARGFDAAAGAYRRARPSYPPGAVEYVVSRLEPGARVCDLAAGTGKFTALLIDRGVDVVAVEPVEGMRAEFLAEHPAVACLDGTAEAMPLPDAGIDAVTVAQAFHWFDHARAIPEIHRVLKPGGILALVWNVRDERTPWVHHITDLIRPYEGEGGAKIPRHRELKWRAPLEDSPLFAPAGSAEFEHGQTLDTEGLVDRVASTSFIAVLPDETRARVLDEVRAMRDRFEELRAPTFVFPYVCEVYLFARA